VANEKRNIYLIGPMGSGKTAVGRQLARDIGREFFDSDLEIEKRTGVEVGLIFEKEGEAGFREREREVIGALATYNDAVVATGGGAILDAINREQLRASGLVVYLKTSVGDQLKRTRRNRTRPLLLTGNPRAVLEGLAEIRTPIYEEIADITLDTVGQRVKYVAAAVKRELAKRGIRALKKQGPPASLKK
jgi:shikimate kinase